jgi:hypothetical protein
VFSCKDFDPSIVKQVVSEYFDAQKFNARVLLRQAPFEKLA